MVAERQIAELAQRRTPPEFEGLAEDAAGPDGIARAEQSFAPSDLCFEDAGVELVGPELQPIPVAVGHQPIGALVIGQDAAQVGNIGPQRCDGLGRRRPIPHLLGQHVDVDYPVRGQQQGGEYRPLPEPAEANGVGVVGDQHRTEQQVSQRAPPPPTRFGSNENPNSRR